MGYLVPGNDAIYAAGKLGAMLASVGQRNADAMIQLFRAYNEYDGITRGQQYQNWYEQLYMLCENLGIAQGRSREAMFPEANYNTFNRDFLKVWRAFNVYYTLKNDPDKELSETASLPDIYNNYAPNYDQFLLEADMFDLLKEGKIFRGGEDPSADKYLQALKQLHFYRANHRENTPFTDEELSKIQKQTEILGRHFGGERGLFSGNDIKAPQDLDKYFERYESMLRDLSGYGEKVSFYNFAQQYTETKTYSLTEDELKGFKRVLERKSADINVRSAENEIAYKELKNTSRLNKEIETVSSESQKLFSGSSDTKEITDELQDAENEIKQLQAEFDKKKEFYQHDLAAYKKITLSPKIRRFEWDNRSNDYNEYRYALLGTKPDVNVSLAEERKQYKAGFEFQLAKYQKLLQNDRNDLEKFYDNLIQNEKIPLNVKQWELNKKFDPSAQEELDKEQAKVEAKLEARIQKSKDLRENLGKKIKDLASQYGNSIRNSYMEELQQRKDNLNHAIEKMKAAKAKMDTAYQNSDYGKKMAKLEQKENLAALTESLGVMTDLSGKTGVWPFRKSDEPQVAANVRNAVKAYLEDNQNAAKAKAAYAECRNYVATYMKNDGSGLKNGSTRENTRQQAVVRMLETMDKMPMFADFSKEVEPSREKNGWVEIDARTEVSDTYKKLDFGMLEASLRKNASVEKGAKNASKEKTAFADLKNHIRKKNKENEKANVKKAKASVKM